METRSTTAPGIRNVPGQFRVLGRSGPDRAPDTLAGSTATAPRLPMPVLSPTYDGPVLLVTAAAIRPDPIHTPIGAPEMLQQASSLGVPIVYLPSDGQSTDLSQFPQGTQVSADDAAGYVKSLQGRLPQAQFFLLGGNRGSDMKAAQVPGVTAWLRNTDESQKDMPKGYQGILTDEYFAEFQNRVVQDLKNARTVSVSCGGNPAVRGTLPVLPVYPNAPALQAPNKLLHVAAKTAWVGEGVASMVAGAVREACRSTAASLALAQGPQPDLQSASAAQLGRAAQDVLETRLPSLEKSRLLYRVLTAHGSDVGHIDSVLTCIDNPNQEFDTIHQKVARTLQGQEAWQWASHMEDGKPRQGDWKGDFERYMDGLTGTTVRPGTKVQVCIDGEEAFKEQLDAIRNAKEFINLSTFVFASDQFGRYYLSELQKAADRGVKINLVVDQTGSGKTYGKLPTDPHLFDTLLEHPNVQFVETPPSALSEHINHRKIMTMDDGSGTGRQVGFIGGMNVANDYRLRWHDVHCKVEGPAVEDLDALFIDQLKAYGGKLDAAMESRMREAQAPQDDGMGVRVVGHWGFQDHTMKMAYLRAINTAAKSIDIADPYVSDPDVIKSLIARAQDGVKVRLFVPAHNNHAYMKWATSAYYDEMLKAGVEIYEYEGHEMAHEKVAVFDNQVTTIGSSNLDARSLQNNEEANIWSTDETLAQEVTERLFNADLAKCRRIEKWEPTFANHMQSHLTLMAKGQL